MALCYLILHYIYIKKITGNYQYLEFQINHEHQYYPFLSTVILHTKIYGYVNLCISMYRCMYKYVCIHFMQLN